MEPGTQLEAVIIDSEDHERGAILQLTGEIDMATGPKLLDAFNELAARDLTDVIVDASQVSFMDSTGLHALVAGKRLIHEHGWTLALIVSPEMRRVLELVFPEPLFAARVDTMQQAREALGWTAAAHPLLEQSGHD